MGRVALVTGGSRGIGLGCAVALAEAVDAEVLPYLSCAPGAVSSAKQLIQSLGPRIDDAVIDHTIRQLVARWETEEAGEGIAAFFDKRKAAWMT